LVVDSDMRRRGIGSALMAAIERCFPAPVCFELFTGDRSAGNLRLYQRLGYVEHHRVAASDCVQLVYLRKRVGADAGLTAADA
ncbi:MAG TPA: GNAT family N-acetyltransferase, partial [Thermomicrobiales bacterium]|nr:GNAT family N-acetyltransferase [Thermomicrobiales bacterium]